MDEGRTIGARVGEARLGRGPKGPGRTHWPTIHAVGRAGALCALLAAGCATAHPDFEQTFRGGRPDRDAWMRLLSTRYGCDTAVLLVNMPQRSEGVGLPSLTRTPAPGIALGMTACTIASLIAPEVVDAWVTRDGIREEWKYRTNAGALTSVYLEGHELQTLQVVPPLPSAGTRRSRR